MFKFKLKRYFFNCLFSLKVLLQWLVIATFIGVSIGGISAFFSHTLLFVNNFRKAHQIIVLGLPLAGILIIFLYRFFKDTDDTGTNMVIASIHSSTDIPFKMAPLIFISTTLTHLFGGSSGREGAAIQLGGSLANSFGKLLHLNENDQHIIIMCGMSAGFSALFGTPMASAIFSLEVISVGIMHYSALVPCVIASFTAHFVANALKVIPEFFPVVNIPALTAVTFWKIILFGAVIGIVSILFCIILHSTENLYKRFLKNTYIRISVSGILIIALSAILRTEIYLGSGISIIASIFEHGETGMEVFLLKMVFTALTLGAGFKGGEIVPSFCIGAAFGCAAASFLGLPPELVAACGMVGLFCGVTNCPITSLLISFELFGFAGMPYYLITIALSYMLSGYYGLYHSQKIMYSKYKTQYVNKKTH